MQIEQMPSPPPTRVILEQGGFWARWGMWIAWSIAGISLLSALASAGAAAQYFQRDAKVVEKYHSLSKMAASKVDTWYCPRETLELVMGWKAGSLNAA